MSNQVPGFLKSVIATGAVSIVASGAALSAGLDDAIEAIELKLSPGDGIFMRIRSYRIVSFELPRWWPTICEN